MTVTVSTPTVNTEGTAQPSPAPPRWLPVVPDAIPRELTNATSWYPAIIRPKTGKVGVWDKIPGDPKTGKPAVWSDSTTRCTFGEAFMAYESGRFQGVGYMMSADAGVIGIDLDHSVGTDGTVAPWALKIVEAFPGAYWERSVSGAGLRGFCRGTLPVGGCRSKIEGCSVELYADQRFLVVTGQAVEYVEVLPTLQAAVDALHTRLTTGRVRATGAAIRTGLTGRATDTTPDELAILEDVMGGRWSATMSEIWGRDDLQVAGASEDDWALEKEIAYCAIRRGYSGDALALTVERIMRAGPYRAKWDEARGGVSWLAQDVANAIQTTQDRLSKTEGAGPDVVFDEEIIPEDAPSDEPPGQTIARLQREIKQLRGTVAVQMTVINGERAEKEALRTKLAEIHALLAVPSKRLSASAKCLAIVLDNTVERTTAYRADPENAAFVQIRYADLAAKTGGSDSTVTRDMKTLSTSVEQPGINDAAPIWKSTRFVLREIDGEMRPTSETTIAPKAEGSILAAAIAFEPEEARKHGGKRIAACPKHPTADLIIRSTTQCAECGDTLNETTQTLRRQDDSLEADPGAPVSVRLSGHQDDGLGGHDGAEQSERAANVVPIRSRTVRHHAGVQVDPEAERRDMDITSTCRECHQYTVKQRRAGVWRCQSCVAVISVEPWAEAPPQPQGRPERCPAPGCAALGFRQRPDGSWGCLRSNHDPSAYPLAAVAGGSE